jgi:hypothetical protein
MFAQAIPLSHRPSKLQPEFTVIPISMDKVCSSAMQRLTQAPNLAIATLWADALVTEGVIASVQRQYLGGVAGELPPDQCLPEVWIHDPVQEAKAHEVLHDLRNVPQRRWFCSCGELVEGGFEQCWNCAALMPP